MSLYCGTYTVNVDSTGRFIIPIEFRNHLGNECVILKGTGCLWIVSKIMADDLEKQLRSMAKGNLGCMLNKKIVALARHIFSGMNEVCPSADRNNRVALTNEQRRYADITKEAVLCGMGSYIEMWNPGKLDECNKYTENADDLFNMGDLLFGLDNKEDVQLP